MPVISMNSPVHVADGTVVSAGTGRKSHRSLLELQRRQEAAAQEAASTSGECVDLLLLWQAVSPLNALAEPYFGTAPRIGVHHLYGCRVQVGNHLKLHIAGVLPRCLWPSPAEFLCHSCVI